MRLAILASIRLIVDLKRIGRYTRHYPRYVPDMRPTPAMNRCGYTCGPLQLELCAVLHSNRPMASERSC